MFLALGCQRCGAVLHRIRTRFAVRVGQSVWVCCFACQRSFVGANGECVTSTDGTQAALMFVDVSPPRLDRVSVAFWSGNTCFGSPPLSVATYIANACVQVFFGHGFDSDMLAPRLSGKNAITYYDDNAQCNGSVSGTLRLQVHLQLC